MPRWTPEEWQRAADVAQFYLHASDPQVAAALGHPSVDADRCEHVLREAAQLGCMPADRDSLIAAFIKGDGGWPTFPGDDEPPLL